MLWNPEGLIAPSQDSASYPYAEPDKSCLRHLPTYLFKFHVDILPSTLRFLKWFISFRYPHGGLGVGCCPLVPKFAGSNPAEAVGFLRAKKFSAHLLSEGK